MSRHTISAREPHHVAVVGWDQPLRTFFAQVEDKRIDKGQGDAVVLWAGASRPWIDEPEMLRAPLAPFAELSDEMAATLRADRESAARAARQGAALLDHPHLATLRRLIREEDSQ